MIDRFLGIHRGTWVLIVMMLVMGVAAVLGTLLA